MKRGVLIKGVGLLVLMALVAGLGACSRSAEVREGAGTTPIATPVSSGDQGQDATPAPVQTVVSVVTQDLQTPGAGAQPTAQEATGTAEPTQEVVVTPMPTSTSAPSSGGQQADYVWHTVQRGETLYSIARRYGTSASVIAQVNGIANPSLIYTGTRLKIPTSGGTSGGSSGGTAACRYRHTVRRGEWVWQIARQYGVSPYAILSANGMSLPSASTIYAGMVLCIP